MYGGQSLPALRDRLKLPRKVRWRLITLITLITPCFIVAHFDERHQRAKTGDSSERAPHAPM